MLHKKAIASNYNQKSNQTEKRNKTTKVGLAYVQCYKTKLDRATKRR